MPTGSQLSQYPSQRDPSTGAYTPAGLPYTQQSGIPTGGQFPIQTIPAGSPFPQGFQTNRKQISNHNKWLN